MNKFVGFRRLKSMVGLMPASWRRLSLMFSVLPLPRRKIPLWFGAHMDVTLQRIAKMGRRLDHAV
jgi:hypothetical protein